jgi:hypothetical protein
MHRPKSCSGTTEVLSLIIIQISGNNMLSTLWALKNSLALCIHDGLITRSLIPIHDGLPHNSSTYHYSRRSLITVQLSLLLHHLFTTTVYDYCLRLLFTTTVYDYCLRLLFTTVYTAVTLSKGPSQPPRGPPSRSSH